jgi:CheY-like chemotaxis protein
MPSGQFNDAEWVLLSAYIPQKRVTPAGILLVDCETNRVYVQAVAELPDWEDEELSHLWPIISDGLCEKALEFGGREFLEWIEDSFSHFLQTGKRETLSTQDCQQETKRLFETYVSGAFLETQTVQSAATVATTVLSPDSVTRVLLIEDNPMDVRMLRFALQNERAWNMEMTVAKDGQEGIEILNQKLTAHEAPDFIILDLNLPKRDGTEVLQWIRRTEGMEKVPVAILSSSPLDVMRKKVSGAHVEADGYFVKPMELDFFPKLASDLKHCYEEGHNLAHC